jgi:hypothetical protein
MAVMERGYGGMKAGQWDSGKVGKWERPTHRQILTFPTFHRTPGENSRYERRSALDEFLLPGL